MMLMFVFVFVSVCVNDVDVCVVQYMYVCIHVCMCVIPQSYARLVYNCIHGNVIHSREAPPILSHVVQLHQRIIRKLGDIKCHVSTIHLLKACHKKEWPTTISSIKQDKSTSFMYSRPIKFNSYM